MTKPAKIPIADVEKIRARSAEVLPPKETEVSRQRAVSMMAPSILAMRERGMTWRQVADWLGSQGLPIGTTALQTVIRRWKAARQDASAGTQRVPTPSRTPRDGKQTRERMSAAQGAASAVAPSAAPRVPAGAAAPAERPTHAGARPSETPAGTFVIRPDRSDL